MKRQKIMAVALLLVSFAGRSLAQPCLTNSLIINTGYDPATGAAVSPGCNACLPAQQDPKWTISATSAAVPPAISGMSGLGTYVMTSVPGPADVVTQYLPDWIGNPVGQPGNWIGCLNGNFYTTNFVFGDPVDKYSVTYERVFNMAICDQVTIDLNVANDNYISSINIDGTTYYTQPAAPNFANENTFTNVHVPLQLCCGPHTIDITVVNWNDFSPNTYNYTGLDVWGTVSSGGMSIVSEAPGCAGYTGAPSVTLLGPTTTPPAPHPYFYEMLVSGPCPSYTINYQIDLNDYPTCSYSPSVPKTITIPSGGSSGFYYWYLTNNPPHLDYVHPYGSEPGGCPACFGPCDPYASGSDWGIYKMTITSVSGCGCQWAGGGSTGGKADHGIVAPAMPEELSIRPNPSSGTFTVYGSIAGDAKTVSLDIVDMLGRTVISTSADVADHIISKEITLGSDLASGQYLIKVNTGNGTQVLRLELKQ